MTRVFWTTSLRWKIVARLSPRFRPSMGRQFPPPPSRHSRRYILPTSRDCSTQCTNYRGEPLTARMASTWQIDDGSGVVDHTHSSRALAVFPSAMATPTSAEVAHTSTEMQVLRRAASPERSSNAVQPVAERAASDAADSASAIPWTVAWRLYLSHSLSTWNSRSFEFGSVLFLAAIHPNTLLYLSIYAMVRSASAILFATGIGWTIDHKARLPVVRSSIGRYSILSISLCQVWLPLTTP